MPSISLEIINFIKQFEGLYLIPYVCPAGYKTIGYGHVIKSSEYYTMITKEQAEEILYNDLKLFAYYITKLINRKLLEHQFNALLSFTFNLGTAALKRSSLRQKVNSYEDQAAASEFMKWTYCKGKQLNGLIVRRRAEAQMYSSY